MTVATSQLIAMFEQPWRCSNCDEMHHGVPDLGFDAPYYWKRDAVIEPNANVRFEGNFLSADFCVIDGEDYFIRCVMTIPIRGLDETWAYGVWSSVSRAHFEQHVHCLHTGFAAKEGPWHGWLSNRLKTYPDTLALPCDLYSAAPDERPGLVVTDYDHPLAIHIRDGMPPEKLIEILEAYGHAPEQRAKKNRPRGLRGLFSAGKPQE